VESDARKSVGFPLKVGLGVLWAVSAFTQQSVTPEIPAHFKLDMETAARLRPQLMAQSVAASRRYATGRQVFDKLVAQVGVPAGVTFAWQLRVVEDDQLNAYASPDGTVYVENRLAQLAGPSAGLWAAILSHEIAHVVRRDWARRYLYQQSLESSSSGAIVLGDPGIPSSGWTDSQKASEDLAKFCRQLEVEADRDGLILMARAGYHPDFVPALHHLLHAQGSDRTNRSLYAMHPCWDERDRELSRAYLEASIEFAHRWPEWYASPGGNPPVVVFADEPKVRKTGSREWEIQIPMHCQNLAGAVEVVLHAASPREENEYVSRLRESGLSESGDEVRQLTGCTSPKTTITFTLTDSANRQPPGSQWTDVYVLDSWGAVLARADLPKLPR
jgi:Peptidase family M48